MTKRLFHVLSTIIVLLAGVACAQGRAYGTINFGDSFAEVTDKIMHIDEIFTGFRSITEDTRPPDDIMRWARKHLDVGGHQFTIDFSFYDDKLYRMTLHSSQKNASYFDTEVAAAHGVLREIVSGAHGAANRSRSVSFLEMRPGQVVFSDIWDTNDDGIMYRVGLGESSSQYYAAMYAEWVWLRDLRQSALDEIDQSSTKKVIDNF